MPAIYANNFSTTLGVALASSTPGTAGQTLTVASGFGAQFPTLGVSEFAFFTITEGTSIEIVKVTAHSATVSPDNFTVTRGFEGVGTAAATSPAFTTAAKVECRIVRAGLNNVSQLDADETITGTKTFTKPLSLSPQAANPAAVAGQLLLYDRNFGGRHLPKWMAPSGVDYFVQDALWESNTVLWKPGAAAGFTFLGDTPTITGTISTPTSANGSFGAEMNKRNIASAATAGTAVGLLGSANQYARIAAAGHGGFFFFCRFRVGANTLTSYRTFLGLSNQGAIPITDPSAGAFSMVGIGTHAADTTFFIMLKDGTTVNRIAVTGSSKVVGNTYDCVIFCPPGNGTNPGNIFYRVDDVNAGTTLVSDFTTGVSTNAPLANAFLRPVVFVGTSTANACNLELAQFYCSSDY